MAIGCTCKDEPLIVTFHRAASHENTYSVGFPQASSTALGHADMVELPLALELGEGFDRVLERDVRSDACGLEQIETLRAPEDLVDLVDTAPQVLRARPGRSVNNMCFGIVTTERTRSRGPTVLPLSRPVRT